MSKKFEGKIGVVTSGSTGMGLATAKRFVQEGMDHVFITGRKFRRRAFVNEMDNVLTPTSFRYSPRFLYGNNLYRPNN